MSLEDFDETSRSLIKGARRILDTLTSVWKFSVVALVGSLSFLGAVAVALYFTILPKEALFIDGFIFLAIAAWIFVRNVIGGGCSCCAEEIPRWRGVLSSFVKPDGTLDKERQGEGILDTVLQVTYASEGWIASIRRELLSMFVWPSLAIIVLFLSVFTLDALVAKIVALAFIAYVFALAVTIYYGVKLKFQGWQARVAVFKANVDRAWQAM